MPPLPCPPRPRRWPLSLGTARARNLWRTMPPISASKPPKFQRRKTDRALAGAAPGSRHENGQPDVTRRIRGRNDPTVSRAACRAERQRLRDRCRLAQQHNSATTRRPGRAGRAACIGRKPRPPRQEKRPGRVIAIGDKRHPADPASGKNRTAEGDVLGSAARVAFANQPRGRDPCRPADRGRRLGLAARPRGHDQRFGRGLPQRRRMLGPADQRGSGPACPPHRRTENEKGSAHRPSLPRPIRPVNSTVVNSHNLNSRPHGCFRAARAGLSGAHSPAARGCPRPPQFEPADVALEVVFAGQILALRGLDPHQAPNCYFPPEDAAPGLLRPGAGRSFCGWKDRGACFDQSADGRTAPRCGLELSGSHARHRGPCWSCRLPCRAGRCLPGRRDHREASAGRFPWRPGDAEPHPNRQGQSRHRRLVAFNRPARPALLRPAPRSRRRPAPGARLPARRGRAPGSRHS